MSQTTRTRGRTATLLFVAAVSVVLIAGLGIGAGRWYAAAGDEATGDEQNQPAEQAAPDTGEQPMTEQATFAAGCFWGVEYAFRQLPGVTDTAVGYMGGTTEHPTYQDVCTDRTGHAEVVQVQYDPERVSYQELLEVFWRIHDPTQVNRQGPDTGTQYRSAIFTFDDGQKEIAERSKAMIAERIRGNRPVATEITPAGTYWKAEDYHQRFEDRRMSASARLFGGWKR